MPLFTSGGEIAEKHCRLSVYSQVSGETLGTLGEAGTTNQDMSRQQLRTTYV